MPSVGVAGFCGALALCWMLNILPSQSKCLSWRGSGPSPLRLLSTPRSGDRLTNVFRITWLY
ncbi:hypothetical protein AVDCRST_MAG84-98 [uncultured Microcoleus sp.]|uniref:Uncharacterized protein n=1 Tax=uncultured Microcoleus sp. TaxID=259945 RepID=A0A6J4KB10_9CYAN|nr:hypothetical protein AVDCRST_MAG84-98 [uncultured Microcoleus sp.]